MKRELMNLVTIGFIMQMNTYETNYEKRALLFIIIIFKLTSLNKSGRSLIFSGPQQFGRSVLAHIQIYIISKSWCGEVCTYSIVDNIQF